MNKIDVNESTLLSNWQAHKCPSCGGINWLDLGGDILEYSNTDIHGCECFTCQYKWIFSPDILLDWQPDEDWFEIVIRRGSLYPGMNYQKG